MRLYQTTRLKHICIGNVTVSRVKECNKTVSAVGSRCLLGLFSRTGVSGPCYLQKVETNIWNGCKPVVYTPYRAYNTCRKDFIRAFSSKYTYEDAFGLARDNPEKFWSEAADGITWFEHWTQTLDKTDTVFPKWFVGGKLNMCYNAVDRHVGNGRGDQAAVIYDSPVTGTKQVITYREVQEQVSRLAGVLVRHGVKMGDLVVIYMPMVPQAMFTMLACARIGATHSLIFGGFASKELSVRIDHAKPKLLVTASFGIEPGRRVEYIPLVEKALELSSHKPHKVLIYNRPSMEKVSMRPDLSLDWEEEMATARPHDCVSLPAHHPLYVLYTSGTTGTPKGVVRDSGGYAVMLNWTMSNIYGLAPGEVWWAASDLGWVVGHSYICYGPLLHGNTTVLYEGKPVGTPDPGAFFRVMSEHGTACMFTAPTAIRAIRQQDPQAEHGKQYPLSRLRNLFVAGERCDIETLQWAKKSFGVPVLDHWWQTGFLCLRGQLSVSGRIRRCLRSCTSPSSLVTMTPWMQVLWTRRTSCTSCLGPMMSSMWRVTGCPPVPSKRCEERKCLAQNTNNNNLKHLCYCCTKETISFVCVFVLQSVLLHPAVVDCAVVGQEDPLKGHVPLALCVLRNDCRKSDDVLVNEMVKLVRNTIGPVAAFKKVVFVKALPKTRSGKIPRSSLANLVNHKPYKISPTIEDPEVFKDIEKVLRETVKGPGK
uniref:Acyl-CoA synthetase short-chain family member 3, mitochondrial n=1 Tax=Cyprinus carpio TaxID=7962 RepID=A0A8C2CLF5_CYPCA